TVQAPRSSATPEALRRSSRGSSARPATVGAPRIADSVNGSRVGDDAFDQIAAVQLGKRLVDERLRLLRRETGSGEIERIDQRIDAMRAALGEQRKQHGCGAADDVRAPRARIEDGDGIDR